MGEQVGIGIVGYGLAGRYYHAPFIRRCPDMRVVAIMARSPERAEHARQDFPEAVVYGQYEDLLADKAVELVDIATPHDTHEALCIQALAAGKHVITDKIMAPDAAGAERMIEAAQKADRVLTVYQNRRWDCDFLTARRAVSEGLLGEVWSVEVAVDNYRAPTDAWRWHRAKGGGRFRDWGAHLFDQALLFAGQETAENVQVWADWQYRFPQTDVETEVITHLVLPSGLRYTIHMSTQQRVERLERRVVGSKATLVIKGIDPQERCVRGPDMKVVSGTEEGKLPRENVQFESDDQAIGERLVVEPGNWVALWQNLADVLLRGAELAVRPEQVLESIRLIDRAAGFDPGPPEY
ncbi:MAG: Gfo/Idh/MocA family oxidoreductase [Armatimonadetes bacterium]|nr:Gfo/Idh/MocA family oxidoreductase [Armatimonadota bacterium]